MLTAQFTPGPAADGRFSLDAFKSSLNALSRGHSLVVLTKLFGHDDDGEVAYRSLYHVVIDGRTGAGDLALAAIKYDSGENGLVDFVPEGAIIVFARAAPRAGGCRPSTAGQNDCFWHSLQHLLSSQGRGGGKNPTSGAGPGADITVPA